MIGIIVFNKGGSSTGWQCHLRMRCEHCCQGVCDLTGCRFCNCLVLTRFLSLFTTKGPFTRALFNAKSLSKTQAVATTHCATWKPTYLLLRHPAWPAATSQPPLAFMPTKTPVWTPPNSRLMSHFPWLWESIEDRNTFCLELILFQLSVFFWSSSSGNDTHPILYRKLPPRHPSHSLSLSPVSTPSLPLSHTCMKRWLYCCTTYVINSALRCLYHKTFLKYCTLSFWCCKLMKWTFTAKSNLCQFT